MKIKTHSFTKNALLLIICSFLFSIPGNAKEAKFLKHPLTPSESDLIFNKLPLSWDEGLPLGNAFVGELIWQQDSALRLSIDRIDLWDLHPCDSLSGERFKYRWVYDCWKSGNYQPVKQKMDVPYDREAVPTKLPGAALEFDLSSLGSITGSHLYIKEAIAEVTFSHGTRMRSFVDANRPTGWFIFEEVPENFIPKLVPPQYQAAHSSSADHPVGGHSLIRLGYEQGTVTTGEQTIHYHQKGYDGFYYDIAVCYKYKGNTLTGVWSATSSLSESKGEKNAVKIAAHALKKGIRKAFHQHTRWWKQYWAQSAVSLPDSVLQKQYDNEIYKFGCLARSNGYIIPLQGVWTADNGMLPPWKGDIHHDLNTQLSYWPAYKGNHLNEGLGYLNTLWKQRNTNRQYTRSYFECDGLAVPGVTTLLGEPMGGWIQYSLSPTVSGWLAQHFYLHWRYSMDKKFLRNQGYPYVKEVATFLEQITFLNAEGKRTLPISSSPEIFDASPKAWFPTLTNYDLGILKNAFQCAARMAEALDLKEDAARWQTCMNELPDWDVDHELGLTFAAGKPYNESHRHFSHAIAIHPFSLIDVTDGGRNEQIVRETIHKLDVEGPDYWCGYSYSWLANLKARAFDGAGAVKALRTFATCFCSPNTFHLNGDQTKSGKSKFTYRPFTLEGNMAFAAGVQEMLLQSHTPIVRVFPAIPAEWKQASFSHLRTEGAFLVSAKRENGRTVSVEILPEAGGELRLENPFKTNSFHIKGCKNYEVNGNTYIFQTRKGKKITLTME